MSRAGPKSGNYLHLVVLAILQQQAPLAQCSTTLQALPYTPKPQHAQVDCQSRPKARRQDFHPGTPEASLQMCFKSLWPGSKLKADECMYKRHINEFLSGNWVCVQCTSKLPSVTGTGLQECSSTLSRAHFKNPAAHEIVGGRLLHVRAQLIQTGVTVDFLAVYQHVWRSHLSHQANKELRGLIWDAFDLTLQRHEP